MFGGCRSPITVVVTDLLSSGGTRLRRGVSRHGRRTGRGGGFVGIYRYKNRDVMGGSLSTRPVQTDTGGRPGSSLTFRKAESRVGRNRRFTVDAGRPRPVVGAAPRSPVTRQGRDHTASDGSKRTVGSVAPQSGHPATRGRFRQAESGIRRRRTAFSALGTTTEGR